ncbi:TPA: LacI family transcriptional regulator [Enterococcus faecium]|nr:LacI family transcriptional regulator [Enterococcus faecium]
MVTIKDIAKAAGVSHTTVSRALNNSSLIKNETKQKIRQLAKEMNYSPNYSAKGLVNQKKYLIGLFFSSLHKGTSSNFLADSIAGIHSVLDTNYSLSVESIDVVDLTEINLQRYDGLIVMSQSDDDQPFIDYLKEKEFPFVVVNRHINDPAVINVTADDAAGVMQAVDYGIGCGHTKIAYIGGKKNFRSTKEREKGVLKSLKKASIPVNPAYFLTGDYSLKSGLQNMEYLLSLSDLPTLVFCGNDDIAIGALRAVHLAGLRVPQNISLIGFDDSPVVSYLNPPLTTVRKPLKEMCQEGTKLLLDLIEGRTIEQSKIELSTLLILRESINYL